MTMETPSQQHYREALTAMLQDPTLRVLLWRLIVEDCKVFEGFTPTNATAYLLLGKQEIGKRILADAKAIDIDLVHLAEKEYNDLMDRSRRYQQDHIGEQDYGQPE